VILLLAVGLPGCHAAAGLVRVDGDGGWSTERRQAEVARAVATTEAPPAGALTLADALALAERGNLRIAEAERDLDAAGARVGQARAHLLPSTTGSGRYNAYTDPQTIQVEFPANLLPPGVRRPMIIVREAEFAVFNGTLTVPLDLSGELRHALAAAQAGYRGERARVWATRLGEQVGVLRAYFRLLTAERLREVIDERIGVVREQLANAEQRFASGRLTRNELLVVQVALRDAEQQRLQRDLAIDQARWALNETIGLPVDAPTTVVDVQARPEIPEIERALDLARANNPDLASILEERQRLEETTRSLERGWLPRVAGGGTIDYNTSTLIQPQQIGSGFVGFTWDLGTDGGRAAEIAEARAQADRSRLVLEQEVRELETAVRTSRQATAERLSALETAEASVAQAEENLRIRRAQFAAGRATSDDVLDAEALLTSQRVTRASALYEAYTRRAELQELIGLPLDALVEAAR
jgi:outer membrane protein TolC